MLNKDSLSADAADYKRKKNKFLKPIHDWVQAHGGAPILPFSGELESKLQDLGEEVLGPSPKLLACICFRSLSLVPLPGLFVSAPPCKGRSPVRVSDQFDCVIIHSAFVSSCARARTHTLTMIVSHLTWRSCPHFVRARARCLSS